MEAVSTLRTRSELRPIVAGSLDWTCAPQGAASALLQQGIAPLCFSDTSRLLSHVLPSGSHQDEKIWRIIRKHAGFRPVRNAFAAHNQLDKISEFSATSSESCRCWKRRVESHHTLSLERLETIEILGSSLSRITLDETLNRIEEWIDRPDGRCHFIATTGFHGIWEAHRDPELRDVLNAADLFCPDGIGPIIISRLRGLPLPGRVPGPDMLAGFAARGDQKGYRSFFYGDTEETLAALKERLERRHPGHRIVGTLSPPFRKLELDEERAMVKQINAARPDVLWVGLGLPKQEWWIHCNLNALRVPVAIGVGAAFRLVSGRVKRAPSWVGRAGFEWLWRLAMEPKKLWRRDLIDGPQFIYRALAETAKIRAMQAAQRRPERRQET
jgi:N-acetylglucosaminyldiphosphoundecaprenol N-acetyl-beta-D-mannosaminyltransferase